jgi:hypothetical protein
MSYPEPQPTDGPEYHAEHQFWLDQQHVREDMRRTLYDEIAAASIDGVMAGIDVMLTFERLNWDDAS